MTLGDFFYISLSNMKDFPHTQLKLQFAFENIFSQFKSSIKLQKEITPTFEFVALAVRTVPLCRCYSSVCT